MSTLSIEKIVTEGSVFVFAGLGYFAMRKLHKSPVFAELDHTCHVKHCKIAGQVIELKELDFDGSWAKFVADLDGFLQLTHGENPKYAWVANRIVTNLQSSMNDMIEYGKTSNNLQLIDATVKVQSEIVPLFDELYEEVIHNMLLSFPS